MSVEYVEYAVQITNQWGEEVVFEHVASTRREDAESVAASASAWSKPVIVSRTVTMTPWTKDRDHVAEAAEVRKQARG